MLQMTIDSLRAKTEEQKTAMDKMEKELKESKNAKMIKSLQAEKATLQDKKEQVSEPARPGPGASLSFLPGVGMAGRGATEGTPVEERSHEMCEGWRPSLLPGGFGSWT